MILDAFKQVSIEQMNQKPITGTPRLIRLPEVISKTGRSRSWIYGAVAAGEFPVPIKLGPKAIAFVESEVDEWIAAKISERVDWAPQNKADKEQAA